MLELVSTLLSQRESTQLQRSDMFIEAHQQYNSLSSVGAEWFPHHGPEHVAPLELCCLRASITINIPLLRSCRWGDRQVCLNSNRDSGQIQQESRLGTRPTLC